VVLRTIAATVALAASPVLVGCDTSSTNPPAQTSPGGAPASKVVLIIRHGEKPDENGRHGIDVQGNQDDSSLTPIGWNRARALVDGFDPANGVLRPGLAKPTTIYAARANDNGEGTRTRETVMPLADKLGIKVNTRFGKGDEEDLVRNAISQPGPTLICWQHGEIPDIADAFGSVTPTPPSEWPDDRFDVVWTLTKTADGWHFAQLPELALPQDQTTPIKD
jgi:hypothetical protein